MTDHLPLKYAKLIVKHTHEILTEEEADQLDEWICASDDNLAIYETLIEEVVGHMFDPGELIEDTERAIEIWMVSGFIAREKEKIISDEEKRFLMEWVEADKQNEAIYKALTDTANLQKFIVWFKQILGQPNGMSGLN